MLGVVAATGASEGATLTQDCRSLSVFATVAESSITDDIGPLSDTAAFGAAYDNLLDTGLLSSLPTGVAEAHAMAAQTSSFDATPSFTSITASGTADTVTEGVFRVGTARADASSALAIQFSVATAQAWMISAHIFDEGNASTAFVQLRRHHSQLALFSLEGTGDLSDSASGVLPSGQYELTAQALAVAQAGGEPRAAIPSRRAAQFHSEIIIVPEPATRAWLIGCLIVTFGSRQRTLRR